MKVISASLVALMLALGSTAALSHGSSGSGTLPAKPQPSLLAEQLTMDLISARSDYDKAGRNAKADHLATLQSIAKDRHDLMAMLMESNPGEVLRMALPRAIQASFPTEASKHFEREVAEEGVLSVIHVDMPGEGIDRFLYSIKTKNGERSLHFASRPPTLLTGTTIRVKGTQLDSAIALGSGSDATVVAAAYPNTFGVQKTLLILVNFSDLPAAQPFTQAQGHAVVFTTTSNFDMENSYQQTSLQGDTTPWYTIASTSATCDYNTIASQAEAAAVNGGFVLANYSRRIYAFPANSCGWWGLGTVGGNPSRAWIHSKYGFTLPVVGHEMGHNFGLWHSHSLDCGADVVCATGTETEYGDTMDIMGGGPNGSSPHFNAFQKELLGWLNTGVSPPLTTVQTTSGNFSIGNAEAARSTTPRALKIANSTSCSAPTTEWYYVEKREAVGFDSFLSGYPNVPSGVVVHRVTQGDSDSSFLLDMTPATSSWTDPALVAGNTFTDPVTGLQITPTSVSAGVANVSVVYPAGTCTHATPSISLNPSATQWIAGGSSVIYTVTVTNTDTCQCAGTAFSVTAAAPSGWTANPKQTAVLAPGASGTVSLTITSPANASQAIFTIPVTTTNLADGSKTASANASISISNTISVTASPNASTYTRPKGKSKLKATITSHVTSGSGTAVVGASVSVAVKNPNNAITTLVGTTDANGNASVIYTITGTSVVGTYAITSTASSAGLSGSGTSSFIVK